VFESGEIRDGGMADKQPRRFQDAALAIRRPEIQTDPVWFEKFG
jgi:hypothetical protein